MSETAPDVLLISADERFRALVGRHRPPAAELRCLAAEELPTAETVQARQVWVDLDTAPAPQMPRAIRRIYFYSRQRPDAGKLPAGLFIRKPCGRTVFELLWAGVELKPLRLVPSGAGRPLPPWLLDFQELRLAPLCHKLVTELPRRLGYRDASLYLHDSKRGLLTLAETSHSRPIDLAVPLETSNQHLMAAVARSERTLLSDCATDELAAHGIARRADRPYLDGACLVAPLTSDGQLWGVLNLSGRGAAVRAQADLPLEEILLFLGRALHHARAYDQARTEARVDSLTGLYNQRWIRETLQKEIRRTQRFGTPLAVLMVDLDGLKTINDRQGHAAGDGVLQHVAGRIVRVLRQFDGAARMGGDEFVIMLPATNLKGAQRVARRLLDFIRQDVPHIRDVPLPVTASIGGVEWRPGWDVGQLLEAADRAMYRAKQSGGDNLVFFADEPATTVAGPNRDAASPNGGVRDPTAGAQETFPGRFSDGRLPTTI